MAKRGECLFWTLPASDTTIVTQHFILKEIITIICLCSNCALHCKGPIDRPYHEELSLLLRIPGCTADLSQDQLQQTDKGRLGMRSAALI